MCDDIGQGWIDWIRCLIVDIHKMNLLNRGDNLLEEVLLESSHLVNEAHLLSVRNAHVGVHVGGCVVQYNECTRIIMVDIRSVQDEHILRISNN